MVPVAQQNMVGVPLVLSGMLTTVWHAVIDMTKGVYCGFCPEACPVDAIVESERIARGLSDVTQRTS